MTGECGRGALYLQETVISILVAGTVELSGSKSPIVAMAAFLSWSLLLPSLLLLSGGSCHWFRPAALVLPRRTVRFFHPPGAGGERVRGGRLRCAAAAAAGVVLWLVAGGAAAADGRWSAAEG